MSTRSEESILKLQRGEQPDAGWEDELARPDLWNSPSGNYGPTAELTLCLIALRDNDQRTLAESALRWERHLEPGVPGVAMRIEPNSSVYVPWIVLPVDGAYHVMTRFAFGQLAAERAHWWIRAWLTVAALGMATVRGKLIDDETDPPGEARPGPVYARADLDRTPWTGAPYQRRNAGVLPSWLCGERSFNRSYPPKFPNDAYRLCRAYLDQSQHSQVAMLALGIDWQRNHSEDGEWPVRYADGLRLRFGVDRVLACLTDEERANIHRAWETKAVEDVDRVLPYLAGWHYDREWVLCSHDNGSGWSLLSGGGGRTSTASTEAATFDAESKESGWLSANNGMRDASSTSDDIVSTRAWEDGNNLCAERSDGRYGVRSLAKPSGREAWRLLFSREQVVLRVPGRPDRVAGGQTTPTPLSPSNPPPPEAGGSSPDPTPGAALGYPACYHLSTTWVRDALRPAAAEIVAHAPMAERNYLAGELRAVARQLDGKK